MSWQQGYAPPNSDRREGVLRRKRQDYLDCVAQYYDIPDIERTDEEINMLRQVFSMQLDYLFDLFNALCSFPSVVSHITTAWLVLLDCCWLP